MSYTKLDAGITDSTIWQAPDATRLVWITMLAMADQNGYVGASMPGLAGRARVALASCIEAIATLEAPDEWSRTKEHQGRRIAPAEGGWVLLNHAKYRALQTADERRERSRLAMAALRAKRKQEQTKDNGYPKLAKLTQAEAEEEATPKKDSVAEATGAFAPHLVPQRASPPPSAAEAKPLTAKDEVWAMGPDFLGDTSANRGLLGRLVAEHGAEAVSEAIAAGVLERPEKPKPWLIAACKQRSKPRINGGHEPADMLADPCPKWAIAAGFTNRFAAENELCFAHNAHLFREGRKIAP